jgi:Tfp pilus assembly protein PilP
MHRYFNKSQLTRLGMIAVIAGVSGCGDKSETPKTIAFYKENRAEAEKVIQKCNELKNNEVSVMSPAEKTVWFSGTVGINCTNAAAARSNDVYQDYQKKLKAEAEKFGK